VAPSEVQRDLQQLEADLRRLEAEYNMFFAGRLPRPPWETRTRVEAVVKRFDRAYIANYGDRFRFTTIQSRFAALVELWDRGMRARDEGGRPVTSGRARPDRDRDGPPNDDRIVHVASFSDPSGERQKLRELYNSLAAARREVGDDPVPFDRFADLVRNHVTRMKAEGSGEVAFRVAVKDGKVSLTARALKGLTSTDEE
jgi:hypothetical protein